MIKVTRYDNLIAQVLNGDGVDQARFAEIALEVLVNAYRAELRRSTKERAAQVSADSGWRIGTRRYVESLERIRLLIDRRRMIRIINESHGALRLVIAAEQVMLSAPRFNGQAILERNLADKACRFLVCGAHGLSVEERVANRSTRSDIGWAFAASSAPRYSGSDGLQCLFADRQHLKLKKDACVNLLFELRLLSESLRALKTHGKTIDWSRLSINHVGAGRA